jgi:hypothetical protein
MALAECLGCPTKGFMRIPLLLVYLLPRASPPHQISFSSLP